jgi:glucose/arabinose dehydrogenase
MRRLARATVVLTASLLVGVVAACGSDPDDRPSAQPAAPASSGPSSPGEGPRAKVPVTVPTGLRGAPFDVERSLELPAGWSAAVYTRIVGARFMAVTPDGALLVSQPGKNAVQLVRKGTDGAGQVTEFIGGLSKPHDMVFAEAGGRTWLFVAETHRVMRYPYDPGDAKAQPGQVVVDGLPDTSTPELRGQYAHVLKNIAVRAGVLYLSIASTCNACASDTVSDPQRATIYTYDAAGTNAGRKLYARGLRNAEGLAFVPGSGDLWVVVNNRDNTLVPDDRDADGDGQGDRGKRITAFVDNYPLEPFTKVVDGGFYGWPFCNPNNDAGNRNMPFHRDVELNADGAKADCAAATRIDVGLPAHSAPLGLTFTQGTKAPDLGAVIPLHGSWNRSTPSGYKVLNFPWTAAGPGEQRDFATGWLDPGTGKSWGRPVDAAVDADGSILISDDASGTVYRLTPPR